MQKSGPSDCLVLHGGESRPPLYWHSPGLPVSPYPWPQAGAPLTKTPSGRCCQLAEASVTSTSLLDQEKFVTGRKSLSTTTNSHHQLSELENSDWLGQRQMLMTSQRQIHCCVGPLKTFERDGFPCGIYPSNISRQVYRFEAYRA